MKCPPGWGADAGELVLQVRSYRPSVPGRLLLCTDGLWRYLPDAEALRSALPHRRRGASARGDGLIEDARSLVDLALDAGGHERYSTPDSRRHPDAPVSVIRTRPERTAPGTCS